MVHLIKPLRCFLWIAMFENSAKIWLLCMYCNYCYMQIFHALFDLSVKSYMYFFNGFLSNFVEITSYVYYIFKQLLFFSILVNSGFKNIYLDFKQWLLNIMWCLSGEVCGRYSCIQQLFTEVEVAGSGYLLSREVKIEQKNDGFYSVTAANDYSFGMQMTKLWLAVCSKIQ